jgi:hypothetical protein
VVWARGRVRLTECPKSFITAESLDLLDRFYAAKLFGFGNFGELPARVADAFCVLEQQLAEEKANVQS